MRTDILHTADTHLGYRQYHKTEREEDFREAFETIVSKAIDHDVDAVVHSGDIFDRSRPSISVLSDLFEQLNRLQDADIDFCTIVGNHDGTRDRQWPELLEDLGLGIYLGYDGYTVGEVTLYGQDFVDEGQRSRLNYQFTPSETETAFLVSHGLFTPFPHGDWEMEELLAKSTAEFDAALLGDDHKPRIDSIEDVTVTYPGSTERTAADQRDKRGYNLLTVENGEVTVDHETIDTRNFRYIDIEMKAGQGVEHVIDRVEDEPIPDGSVVIVTLTGDGKRVPSADIERVGIRDGALVVRVNDRREFDEADSEFEEVTFADPNDAVRERKSELPLSPVADDLEQIARDIEEIPESNLKDITEERVDSVIEERDEDAFTKVAAYSEQTDTDNRTPPSEEVDSPETTEDLDGEEIRGETESDSDDDADSGQMSFGDL